MSARVGHWSQTFTGRRFYPCDPRPEDVVIEDIAHALSMVCRFGGHCPTFYSVAEHSVRVSDHVKALGGSLNDIRWGLLHDAAEAYLGDVVWPVKNSPQLGGYGELEARVEAVIAERFGLVGTMPAVVKHADVALLATEKRDLMALPADAPAYGERWYCDDVPPLAKPLEPQPAAIAKIWFTMAFGTLFPVGVR